jgi:nitrite reductase/ring-hydroxylating ferredoxin subunit/uncharacterized membrane protein
MDPAAALAALEDAQGLDNAAAVGRKVVQRLPAGRLKDTLHGVHLGHPLHPLLAQVALGSFVSAGVLDTRGRRFDDAVRQLIGAGLVASLPAAAAGAVDWADSHEQQQRVGLVHATANVLALSAYAGSLAARAVGRRGLGRALAFGGLAVVSLGGYLGGHLAFRQATGANHAEDVPHLVEPGWQRLGRFADLPEGASRHQLGGVAVLVHREGARVHVLADRCPHLSAPLSVGKFADGCVTCPWHGSVFRLDDGAVVHGPATAPVPRFEIRMRKGVLKVRLPGAG